MAEELLCTFFIDKFFLGIEVAKVQEVLLCQQMTRVPLASWEIRGLINLRGQIVTAIDLRRRMELPDIDTHPNPVNVVVRSHHEEVVSLLVDKIGDVIEVAEKNFEGPPETLQGTLRTLLRGVYKLNGKLLLVLDPDKITEIPAPKQQTT